MSAKENLLLEYRKKYGLTEVVTPCTPEEFQAFSELKRNGEALPEGVVFDNGSLTFVRKEPLEDLTSEEINELLKYKELDILSDIRRHTTLFYVLAIIGIIGSIIGVIALLAS